MQRYRSIDILRGLAIILMIQVHFVENLSPRESPTEWLYDVASFLGGLPAPLFTFVSGLSYGLWLRKQESLGRRDAEITGITLRRGAFLFATGIAFNFFIWLPEDTFNWDILTLIGTSLLFLAFARNLPSAVLALVCVMVLLASPLLRVVSDFPSYWEDHAYTYDFTIRDIFFGFIANGYFPVFPWLLYPLMGFISGDLIFRSRAPVSARWWLGALGITLLILAGIGVFLGADLPAFIARHYASGFSEFPASTEYVFATLGVTVLSLLLLNRWADRNEGARHNGFIVAVLGRFSAFSLTIYILHHMVILWPLWLYGLWMGQDDPTYFWRRAMTTPMAFALAAAFIVACHFVLIWLENHKKYALESLMRWACD